MYLKVTRTLTFIVVLMMSLQIVAAAANTSSTISNENVTLHIKKPAILNLLFEKVEEESEKTDEEKDRMTRVVLIDFSQVVFSLSFSHTPQIQLSVLPCLSDVRPPVHELNCVLLI